MSKPDPLNPSLVQCKRTTLQRIEDVAGPVVEARHPYYLCQTGVMIYQSPRRWHWFDNNGGTGSGSTPERAVNFGYLGDVIDNSSQLAVYARLVRNAPDWDVAGLWEAQRAV